jgi:hypothetical protein
MSAHTDGLPFQPSDLIAALSSNDASYVLNYCQVILISIQQLLPDKMLIPAPNYVVIQV